MRKMIGECGVEAWLDEAGKAFLLQVYGDVSVAVDGTVITLPEGVEAALEYIRREGSFTPESLPGLERESRLILAQSMLDCRLIERVE